MSIGEIIKNRRTALKITQESLSDISGVGLRTIVNIENDCGNPSLNVLRKVADTLGMEITLQVKNPKNE